MILCFGLAVRIDDKDSDCDDWQVESGGVTYPLQLLGCWIRKMSLGGVWGSGATYRFVQDACVTSFIPLAVVGQSRLIKLGWGALHWTETSRAEPCRFGPHPVLRHLSK